MIDIHKFVACPCESYGKGDEQSEEIDEMESSITRTERYGSVTPMLLFIVDGCFGFSLVV